MISKTPKNRSNQTDYFIAHSKYSAQSNRSSKNTEKNHSSKVGESYMSQHHKKK